MAHIAIAIPSSDTWKAGTGLDLACMVGTFSKLHGRTGHSCDIINAQISVLSKGRMDLVMAARKQNATHILFIDSDARFPKETLDRLLAHDLDFVACNAVRRTLPCTPTSTNGPGQLIWTMPDSYGLEQVHDHVGLHTALVKMSVFDRIEQPWFMTPWLVRQQEYQGEDVWFCHRVIDAGIDIWIDHDLSLANRHAGNFDYSHQLAAMGRAEYEAEAEKVRKEKEAEFLAAQEAGDEPFVAPPQKSAVLELETV